VRWIRNLLKGLAEDGRTVFLSSHLMSEMALTADHVILVGKGRLLRDQSMADFIAEASSDVVRVRSPQAAKLAELLAAADVTVRNVAEQALEVQGLTSDQIGVTAAAAGITLLELSTQAASLEDAYMALTEDSIDYRSILENTKDAA
jgi:ABC-2 type transport system ATP-binding protein